MAERVAQAACRTAHLSEGLGVRLVAGALLALGLLTGCQDDEPYVAPTPTASSDAVAPAAASRTLDELARALRRHDTDAAAALGSDDDAVALLRSIADTAEALELTDVTFTYLTENGQVDPGGAWTAAVATTWRIDGFDRRPARAEVEFSFADGGRRIGSVGGGAGQAPVWTSGATAVRRTDDVVVLVADRAVPIAPLAAASEQALVVARRVLGDRARRLVVEVPASAEALDAALGQPTGTYDSVAAVTASADGANVPGTPVHVFLNPAVFQQQGPVSDQVVLSHEAVHAVTATPTTSGVENWLLEGFADYVAFRDVDLPVSKTAGQIIEQVRADGVPDALPSRADLATSAPALGAAYEASWLVCVTLAEHGGEEALVRFYEAVVGGADLEDELRRHFGWTVADLTRAWQDRLRSVSAVGG